MTTDSSGHLHHLLDFCWQSSHDGGEPFRRKEQTMTDPTAARTPEDLTRLFVDRANEGDADGAAALYEPDAVLAYPPGSETVGRDAIRDLFVQMFASRPHFEPEPPLPTIVCGDLALTSTPPKDDAGARAQVVRRQPDGTWLRLIDQPEFRRA
jgi:ketosteroid isomerase-like protein